MKVAKPESVLHQGFTLVELIIALAIVAVLATVALPSFETQIIQTNRSDATTALTTFAQKMERYFLENGSYSGASTATYQENSNQGYYQLSVTTSSNSYQLEAAPTGTQADDSECGSFLLNQTGTRSISGTGTATDCW